MGAGGNDEAAASLEEAFLSYKDVEQLHAQHAALRAAGRS